MYQLEIPAPSVGSTKPFIDTLNIQSLKTVLAPDRISVGRATVARQDVISFLTSLPSESVDLIVTDPAYSGMNQHLMLGKGRIVGKYSEKDSGEKWFSEFHDTAENYRLFLQQCYRVMKPNRHIFVMFDSFSMLTLASELRQVFNVKNVVTWDKVNIGMGHYFRRQSEFIIFASKGKRPLSRRDIPDIWKIKRLHRAAYPTQKPVELFEAMIASSKTDDDQEFVVCDPFAGSGSSALAALRQGASFIGCDVSTKALEICAVRLQRYVDDGVDLYQPKSAFDAATQKKFW